MFGLSLHAFTQAHVAISLIAILAGIVFFVGLIGGRWSGAANGAFLVFTILTSVTGLFFPPKPIGPPFLFGVISLVLLAVALIALYARGGVGPWRGVYLVAALLAQWLNMVVLIVQGYQKVPALHAFAPTGAEPAVLGTQAVLLIAILYAGWRTILRARRPMVRP